MSTNSTNTPIILSIVTLLNNGADIPTTVTARQNQFLSDLLNLVNTQNANIWSGLATVNAPR